MTTSGKWPILRGLSGKIVTLIIAAVASTVVSWLAARKLGMFASEIHSDLSGIRGGMTEMEERLSQKLDERVSEKTLPIEQRIEANTARDKAQQSEIERLKQQPRLKLPIVLPTVIAIVTLPTPTATVEPEVGGVIPWLRGKSRR